MELHAKTQAVTTAAVLLDAAEERPVDADVVLPDYCPDVAAILTCELVPSVTANGWNGDKLTVEGTALVRVLYLAEDRRCVHTYEVSQAFSAGFLTDGRQGETAVTVTAATEYVHCRAVSPRRLDIHGAFCVKATAMTTNGQTVLAEVADDTTFLKTEEIAATVPAVSAQKPFSVNETLGNAAGIARVLRSSAVPAVSEVKVLAGKAIVKGDLHIACLLAGEGEDGKTTEKAVSLPFSQMVDLPGVDDSMPVEARASVSSHSLRVEDDGGGKILYSSTKLLLSAQAWKEETSAVVTDVYSTAMPVMAETTAISICRLANATSCELSVKKTVELPNDVAEILSVWCEAMPLSAEASEQKTTLSGRLTVHLLGTDGEGQVQYYERTADFSELLDGAASAEEDTLSVLSSDVSAESVGQMTVTARLCVSRRQFENTEFDVVTDVTGDESAAYPASDAAVKILYAEAGESLWDVAKVGHTSVARLKAENELECDILEERTMLLVPLM